jgi:peptidoglycan/LPS O-acetylase OafA/YrhL
MRRPKPHPHAKTAVADQRGAHVMEFREDINGLRAFAVAAVVLYHFGLLGFEGGFAGVDVFFVISGFLMTGIILTRLHDGRFSLMGFYASRLRRILPALAALCATLLALGYFWLLPSDYAMLGKHAAAAAGFVSNIVFKGEKGYFDAPSRDKWLLHTWSLSVEGQFYVLFPLVALAAEKLRRHIRRKPAAFSPREAALLLAALGFVSFAVSALTPVGKAAGAFFLLPGRVWEFMAGGSAWLVSRQKKPPLKGSIGAEILGMALMLVSFFAFNSDTFWPGYACALPVAGAVLVILAARENSPLTSNPAAHWLGKWSYSIYLWHWPIFVGLGYAGLQGTAAAVTGIAASVAAGAASYAFIENPGREALSQGGLKASFGLCFAAMALVAGAGGAVLAAHGLEYRVPQEILAVDRLGADRYDPDKGCFKDKKAGPRKCLTGDGPVNPDVKIGFVLWGDSHADVLGQPAMIATAGKIRGMIYSLGCPTIFGAVLRGKAVACDDFNLGVLNDIKTLPKGVPVIVLNRYSYYLLGANEGLKRVKGIDYADVPPAEVRRDESGVFARKLEASLCTIAAAHTTYAVLPIPEMGRDVPKIIGRRLMAGRKAEEISISLAEYQARNQVVLSAMESAHRQCGVKLLDPRPYLCKKDLCRGSEGLKPLYFDDNHLNEWGDRRLAPMFAGVFPGKTHPGAR